MEALQAFAGGVVIDAAVGKHAIHIGDHQANVVKGRPRDRCLAAHQRPHLLQAFWGVHARAGRFDLIRPDAVTRGHQPQLLEFLRVLHHRLWQAAVIC
ncbi:hypothetical protein D3C80_1499990 [compost metagenome]